jgi:hypothetical protein
MFEAGQKCPASSLVRVKPVGARAVRPGALGATSRSSRRRPLSQSVIKTVTNGLLALPLERRRCRSLVAAGSSAQRPTHTWYGSFYGAAEAVASSASTPCRTGSRGQKILSWRTVPPRVRKLSVEIRATSDRFQWKMTRRLSSIVNAAGGRGLSSRLRTTTCSKGSPFIARATAAIDVAPRPG